MENDNCTNCDSNRLVLILLSNYESITERITELREIIEKLKCDENEEIYYIKYLGLFSGIYNDLRKLSLAEEDFLFTELKSVLPDSSSIRALKAEQEETFFLCDLIHNCSMDRNSFNKNIEIVEDSILKLDNLLERVFHKKNIVLHHEALGLLDCKTLKEIAEKLEKAGMDNK